MNPSGFVAAVASSLNTDHASVAQQVEKERAIKLARDVLMPPDRVVYSVSGEGMRGLARQFLRALGLPES